MNKKGFFGLIITLVVIALIIGGIIFFLQLKDKIFGTSNEDETDLSPEDAENHEEIIVNDEEKDRSYIENLLDI